MPMSTFDKDGDEAWRKCWVCDTRVYVVTGDAAKGNIAPINTWVEVNLTNGVLVSLEILGELTAVWRPGRRSTTAHTASVVWPPSRHSLELDIWSSAHLHSTRPVSP